MPLCNELRDVVLTFVCRQCGRQLLKKGGWFMGAHSFKCEGCGREVRLSYDDKLVLFANHVHLAKCH